MVCGVGACGGVSGSNLRIFSRGCAVNSRIRGTSNTVIHSTTLRSVRFPTALGTVTHTNTNAGGVPVSHYDRRNVMIFGAPNTGTGTIGRLILTNLLLSSHHIISNVR